MLRDRRILLLALSIFSWACAHRHRSPPTSGSVRESDAIATDDSEDDTADYRDPTMVTDDSAWADVQP